MDKENIRKLASREGIDHQSKPVPMASRIKLDLVVIGSVAVDKLGHRIGKGTKKNFVVQNSTFLRILIVG